MDSLSTEYFLTNSRNEITWTENSSTVWGKTYTKGRQDNSIKTSERVKRALHLAFGTRTHILKCIPLYLIVTIRRLIPS